MQKEIRFKKYGQYKKDIFEKLNFNFEKKKKMLDVGCGDGSDGKIFVKEFELNTYGIDVYQHKNVKKIKNFKFKKAGIYKIPFKSNFFDYVFLHDVLHHIDEKHQNHKKHLEGLNELSRICKNNGKIIILEANRFNPLSYFHMTVLRKHNHFRQKYLNKIIKEVFKKNIEFKSFEAHFYPSRLIKLFKIYEFIMEHFSILTPFRNYNLVVIKNDK